MADLSKFRNAVRAGSDLRGAARQSKITNKSKTAPPPVNQSPSKLMDAALKFVGGKKNYTPTALGKFFKNTQRAVQRGHTEGLTKTELAAFQKVRFGGIMGQKTKQTIAAAAVEVGRELKREHQIGGIASGLSTERSLKRAAGSVLKGIAPKPDASPPKPEPPTRMTLDQLRGRLGIQQTPYGSVPTTSSAPTPSAAPAPRSGPTVNFINPTPITAAPSTPTGSPTTPIYSGRAVAGRTISDHSTPVFLPADHQAEAPDDKTSDPKVADEKSATPIDDDTTTKDEPLPSTDNLSDPFVGE